MFTCKYQKKLISLKVFRKTQDYLTLPFLEYVMGGLCQETLMVFHATIENSATDT